MMAENDFDEDVISKHSPLYSYMDEVGMAREEAPAGPGPGLPAEGEALDDGAQVEHAVRADADTKWSFFSTKSMCNKLWLKYVSSYMFSFHTAIVGSTLLYEDDRQNVEYLGKAWPSIPATRELVRFLLRKGISALVLVAFMAWTAVSSAPVLLLLLLTLVSAGAVGLRLRGRHRALVGCGHSLRDLIPVCERLDALARKCVLFVQEAEVVARGFTFVSVRGSIGGAESGGSRGRRQCPQLRRSLYFALRNCVRLLRSQATRLVAAFPAIRSHDAMHCLADLEESEYGACFSVDSEAEALQLTDHFAIPALRAMYQLYSLHVSEMFRLLSLAAFVNVGETQTAALDFRPFYFLCFLTDDLRRHLSDLLLDLADRLEAHQRAALALATGDHPTTPAQRPNPRSDALTAVHSLSLHLQAALVKSHEAEQSMEAEADAADLCHLLDAVRGELDASLVCLEESCKRLAAPPSQPAASPLSESPGLRPSGDAERPPPRVVPAVDPVIEDEVLEAFVESDADSGGERGWDDDAEWASSREEARARRQRERERAKAVLGELKSVIAGRARQWAKRERRALRRRRAAGGGGDLSSDSASAAEEEEEQQQQAGLQLQRTAEEQQEKQRTGREQQWGGEEQQGDGEELHRAGQEQQRDGQEQQLAAQQQQHQAGEEQHQAGQEQQRAGKEQQRVHDDERDDGDDREEEEDEAVLRHRPCPPFLASALASAALSRRQVLGAGAGEEEQFGDSSGDED